jgi:hypothetical protein
VVEEAALFIAGVYQLPKNFNGLYQKIEPLSCVARVSLLNVVLALSALPTWFDANGEAVVVQSF